MPDSEAQHADFLDVLSLAELPPGGQKGVCVGSQRVLLCRERESNTVWAVHDECPHAFQPLNGGRVRGGWITCPQHGACFDLQTGKPQNTRITARPFAGLSRAGRATVACWCRRPR